MLSDLISKAVSHHNSGRPGEAEVGYRRALAAGGAADPQLHYLLALALYQQHKAAEALAILEASPPAAAGAIDPLMLRGVLLRAAQRIVEAQTAFAQALAWAPGHADALYNNGACLLDLGRPAEALDMLDRALAARATPLAWINRGAALHRLGRHIEALASLDAALTLGPANLLAIYNRGVVLNALDRPAEALDALDTVVGGQPRHAEAWLNRGVALHALGRLAEAVGSYREALTLESNSSAAWSNLGGALQRLGRHAEAVESFDRAIALAPDRAETWRHRGESLVLLKRFDDALVSFDAVLRLDPAAAGVGVARAGVLNRLRRFDEALAGYDLILRADPTDIDAQRNRAVTLVALQRFEEAMAGVDAALELDPDDEGSLLMKGQLLCELGAIDDGMAMIALRAAQLYGQGSPPPSPPSTAEAAAAQARHDAEQRAYLASVGIRGGDPASGRYHIEGGGRVPGGAVNARNRVSAAAGWARSDPQVVVIDDVLTPAAMEGLRRFCHGSTVWRKAYARGYLGAFFEFGFACPLLAQIAEELSAVFPTIIGDHGLMTAWAFKYDSRLAGIPIHADQAAVNVNFWLAPNEANLNPQSGGMVIWDKAAPEDWSIERYNGDDVAVRGFLRDSWARPITVPHRCNRAVIFNSDLFHETDEIAFADDYLNRRINVTMLFGRRTFHNE